MKILFYGINFAPELTGIGKYTGEMAVWLSKQTHEVRVVCAPPYYPAWKVDDAYSSRAYKTEMWSGVRVFRTPVWVPEKPSGVKRLLHLMSFAIASLPAIFWQWSWKPDVVVVVEPPLMCAPGALGFAAIRGCGTWLHVQDYEVDAAFDLGLLKGNVIRRLVLGGERWLMKRFDRISTISGKMLDRAENKGISREKLVLFPNWVDIGAIRPLLEVSQYRAEIRIPDQAIVALYSGNMGGKQGLEVLAQTARMLQNNLSVFFVFCGDGAEKPELIRLCEGLQNVRFLPLQPFERLNELLGMADIHLLPQRADAADLVMPSKLTGMLASGRPVIATCQIETELGRVITEDAACGVVVPPGNPAALATALSELASDFEVRKRMGRNARQYAEDRLDKDSVMKRFESMLQACMV